MDDDDSGSHFYNVVSSEDSQMCGLFCNLNIDVMKHRTGRTDTSCISALGTICATTIDF